MVWESMELEQEKESGHIWAQEYSQAWDCRTVQEYKLAWEYMQAYILVWDYKWAWEYMLVWDYKLAQEAHMTVWEQVVQENKQAWEQVDGEWFEQRRLRDRSPCWTPCRIQAICSFR